MRGDGDWFGPRPHQPSCDTNPELKIWQKIRWAWASISDPSWWAKGNADYTYTSKFRGRFHYVYLIPLYLNLYF